MSIKTPDYLAKLSTDAGKLKLTANHGYVVAPQKIMRCFRLTDFEKLLLLDLMSFMGNKDYAFPSHKYLAIRHGKKSTTSIKETLNALYVKGFLDWYRGGGDMGTNRYMVGDLFINPYIILSEATYFLIDTILEEYRSVLSYEKLYGAIQEFINVKKTLVGTEDDKYSIYLNHLRLFPHDRDNYTFYQNFFVNLLYFIEERTGFPFDKICPYQIVRDHFKKYHKDLADEENIIESSIYDKIPDPYFSLGFEVVLAEGYDPEAEATEIKEKYYVPAQKYIMQLNDSEVIEEFLAMCVQDKKVQIFDGDKLLYSSPNDEYFCPEEMDTETVLSIGITGLRKCMTVLLCEVKFYGTYERINGDYICPI